MKVVFRWIRTSGASQSPGVARQRALSSFPVVLAKITEWRSTARSVRFSGEGSGWGEGESSGRSRDYLPVQASLGETALTCRVAGQCQGREGWSP